MKLRIPRAARPARLARSPRCSPRRSSWRRLFAHHGWSEYDTEQPLTLQGRIQASSYANPHATITLDAAGKRYTVVLAPVSRMEARGASRESVAVGQDVTVVGYREQGARGRSPRRARDDRHRRRREDGRTALRRRRAALPSDGRADRPSA